MWNYLFEIVSEWSENCGEQFFIQCNTKEEADELLASCLVEGEHCDYLGRFTDEEAEMMGFDTY